MIGGGGASVESTGGVVDGTIVVFSPPSGAVVVDVDVDVLVVVGADLVLLAERIEDVVVTGGCSTTEDPIESMPGMVGVVVADESPAVVSFVVAPGSME